MTRRLLAVLLAIAALCAVPASSVTLDADRVEDITIAGDITVRLHAAAGARNDWYYLPTGGLVRLARKSDGTPEFLLLEHRADEASKPEGGLVHFLVEWGLTKHQRRQVERELQKRRRGAKLRGVADLQPLADASGHSFRIKSATMGKETGGVVASGVAPPTGSRAAVASWLGAEQAEILGATLEPETSIADVSVNFDYTYQVQVPAAKGKVTFDWKRLEQVRDRIDKRYEKTKSGSSFSLNPFKGFKNNKYSYSYSDLRDHFDMLEEEGVVRLEWSEQVKDERVEKIRNAFFDYFVNKFTQPSAAPAPPPVASEEGEGEPDIRKGTSYEFTKAYSSLSIAKRKEVFRLDNIRLAVRRPLPVTANLRGFRDSIADCTPCRVKLVTRACFFSDNRLDLLLNLTDVDLFTKHVNYATINVRKPRGDGSYFEDTVTFTADRVAEKGLGAHLSYAKVACPVDPGFEYQIQWAFKSGGVVPKRPRWRHTDGEALHIEPPLRPRTIEFETDMAELRAAGFTRATLELRVPQKGRKKGDHLVLRAASGEPLVEKTVFADPGARRFGWRVVLHHKREGRMSTPWTSRSFDDAYVYAPIPEDMLAESDLHGSDADLASEFGDDDASSDGEFPEYGALFQD